MLFFSFFRPLYKLGPLEIPSYYLFLTLAFVAGTWFVISAFKKRRLNPVNALDLSALMVICGLFGARLLHAIAEEPAYYFKNFLSHPFRLLMVWQGGFAYLGGFLLCLPAAYIFMKRRKMDFLETSDIFIQAVALGIGIARIGCLLAGCCYGRPTDSVLGIKYYIHDHIAPQVLAINRSLEGVALYPTQLLLSLNGFFIFLLLFFLDKKRGFKGQLFSLFLMIYSFNRFFIEYLRNDERGELLALSTSQLLGIPLFLAGLVLYFYLKGKNRTNETYKT